jgi:hypothetical protein
VHSKALFFHAKEFTAHDRRDRLVEKMIRPVAKIETHLGFETVRRQTGPLGVPVALQNGTEDEPQKPANCGEVRFRQLVLRSSVGIVAHIQDSRIVHQQGNLVVQIRNLCENTS